MTYPSQAGMEALDRDALSLIAQEVEDVSDNIFLCPGCGEETTHYDENLCQSCWWVETMDALNYGEA